jgi:malate dehydrogenase
MARKKIALIGSGMIGGTLAHIWLARRTGRRRPVRHCRGHSPGQRRSISPKCRSGEGFDAKITGVNNDYADIAGADVMHRHRRRAAQAGHEPRRSAGHQPQA